MGEFENQQDADAWLADTNNIRSWGGSGNFTSTQTDISAQVALDNAIRLRNKMINAGLKILAGVMETIKAKGVNDAAADAFYDNAVLSRILSMLQTGSLSDARRNINNADLSALLTSEEKTALLVQLDAVISLFA